MTPAELAALCALIHAEDGGGASNWTRLSLGVIDGTRVCWAIKRTSTLDVVVFRATLSFWDWIRDAEALADPFDAGPLGPVHSGFNRGLDAVWRDIAEALDPRNPFVLTGHSLGGARACLIAGRAVVSQRPPASLVTFGCPRPAFRKLHQVIAAVPQQHFRNRNKRAHDLITDVPYTTLVQRYVPPAPIIDVSEPPSDAQVRQSLLFAWHGIELYQAAVARLKPGETSP